MLWAQAGKLITIGPDGMWYAAIPEDKWNVPPMAAAIIKKDFQSIYGNRRAEIVFIGQKMDEAAISKELDSCLLSDEDFAAGPDTWKSQFRAGDMREPMFWQMRTTDTPLQKRLYDEMVAGGAGSRPGMKPLSDWLPEGVDIFHPGGKGQKKIHIFVITVKGEKSRPDIDFSVEVPEKYPVECPLVRCESLELREALKRSGASGAVKEEKDTNIWTVGVKWDEGSRDLQNLVKHCVTLVTSQMPA